MLQDRCGSRCCVEMFQWAPTLGGECYWMCWMHRIPTRSQSSFNGHPPLGVNATAGSGYGLRRRSFLVFQWAPTLGGECYVKHYEHHHNTVPRLFQWAPTLGGECYTFIIKALEDGFLPVFQWAPTLGGECYVVFWGLLVLFKQATIVSMGTHPWG